MYRTRNIATWLQIKKAINYNLRHYPIALRFIEYNVRTRGYDFVFNKDGVLATLAISVEALEATTVDTLARQIAEHYGIEDYPYDAYGPLIGELPKGTAKIRMRRKIRA